MPINHPLRFQSHPTTPQQILFRDSRRTAKFLESWKLLVVQRCKASPSEVLTWLPAQIEAENGRPAMLSKLPGSRRSRMPDRAVSVKEGQEGQEGTGQVSNLSLRLALSTRR